MKETKEETNLTYDRAELLWVQSLICISNCIDDVIKSKHFQRYWPFVCVCVCGGGGGGGGGGWFTGHRFIRSLRPVTPLMFSLICAWKNGWANNQDIDDLRRRGSYHDVTVMLLFCCVQHHVIQFQYSWRTPQMSFLFVNHELTLAYILLENEVNSMYH